jgi:hypothetical protein
MTTEQGKERQCRFVMTCDIYYECEKRLFIYLSRACKERHLIASSLYRITTYIICSEKKRKDCSQIMIQCPALSLFVFTTFELEFPLFSRLQERKRRIGLPSQRNIPDGKSMLALTIAEKKPPTNLFSASSLDKDNVQKVCWRQKTQRQCSMKPRKK